MQHKSVSRRDARLRRPNDDTKMKANEGEEKERENEGSKRMPRGVRRRVVTCLTRCFAHPSSSFASTLDLFLIPFSREISFRPFSLFCLTKTFLYGPKRANTNARKEKLPSHLKNLCRRRRSFVRPSRVVLVLVRWPFERPMPFRVLAVTRF